MDTSQGTFTYPNGTHICELEINKETGSVIILSYCVVDDFGKVINPMLLEGQVHGGIVQGIGQALFEETLYDENGQLISGSLMDYAIPRASDVPNFKFSYNEVLCKNNLLGVKGAGEAGAIGAPPAVINALCNALNINHIDMPAKPEKIWKIIKKKITNFFLCKASSQVPLVDAFEYSVALFSKKLVCSTPLSITSIQGMD